MTSGVELPPARVDTEPAPRYDVRAGRLVADVSPSSWPGSALVLDRVAAFYSTVLPSSAVGVLLDLGCGQSPMRPYYETFVERSWSIDWPSGAHQPSLDVYADLNLGVPIRSGAVDTVLVSDVLEHLARPEAILAEIHRVLGPGGRVIGSVPFMYWLHEEPHDYFRYTEHGLRELFTRAGFDSTEVFVIAGGVDVVVDSVCKLSCGLPLFGRGASRLMARAWLALSRCGAVRRLNGQAASRMPLEYGFIASVDCRAQLR
jgi:SAM-dependent methyltransferase